ncbi:DUF6182 family protein [Solwaraspora sp. WMMD406]|uniref:DUF6182 family protein n=1 Tax=Solwaraspora sp. WMMD406 TaxID=3016095 RepID=UPI002415A169|nr:DUF6182 family protein [Solwaraspora sp. WMMD406]MDG4767462.1 DUF6182 family protein [Solwaraspora sp. WMMD406]
MTTPATTVPAAPGPLSGSSSPTADDAQQQLRALLARRIEAARPELARRHDLADPYALRAVREEIARGDNDGPPVSVVVVLGTVDLTGWIRDSCVFAAGLDATRARLWRRSFTRTLFLAGDPGNLCHRFTFDQVSTDATMAWSGPAPDATSAGLRRLLRTYDGKRPVDGAHHVVRLPVGGPGPEGTRRPRRWRVELCTIGLTVADALIHLNHLLAEAVLDGLVGPGDELTVRPVPRLTGTWEAYPALRIDVDSRDPQRLRAYAGLTDQTPPGGGPSSAPTTR